MEFVRFYSLDKNGKQEIIGSVILENGIIKFSGLNKVFISDLKEGVMNYKLSKFVYPKDGLKFLEVLPLTFTGTYLRASEVMEG